MLCHEFKKLFVKQYGLMIFIIFAVLEIAFLVNIYPSFVFNSDITKIHYAEYLNEFSGALTIEKEQRILAEQEYIIDAKNTKNEIMTNMRLGEYDTEEEYLAEFEPINAITECSEAFDILFEKYNYASQNPENRYILSYDYAGLTTDFPDVFILVVVILSSALLFLNEESSGVISFIRISENGKLKTARAKLLLLFLYVLFIHLFKFVAELEMILYRGDLSELFYPVQSIESFGSCGYDISIFEMFISVSLLRFFGSVQISATVILLSVTIKNPLFTIFVPSAFCLLQQFLFDPAAPAYYTPAGLLRAVGYIRGISASAQNVAIGTKSSTSENMDAALTEIPFFVPVAMTCISVILAAIAVLAAGKCYCGYEPQKERSCKN